MVLRQCARRIASSASASTSTSASAMRWVATRATHRGVFGGAAPCALGFPFPRRAEETFSTPTKLTSVGWTRGVGHSAWTGTAATTGKGEDENTTREEDVGAGVPGMSPLSRSPAPTSALRGAFIPGALTDEGTSEQARAILREAKGSPKKFGAFLRVIRGLSVEDALIQCDLSPKRVAKTVGKVILSAVGNAVNNQGLDRDRLVVAEATVGKGKYLRRVSIHGRGRAGVMHRPRSHVTIHLEERDDVKRRVQIDEEEMPWVRRRRLGREKQAMAEAAGIV